VNNNNNNNNDVARCSENDSSANDVYNNFLNLNSCNSNNNNSISNDDSHNESSMLMRHTSLIPDNTSVNAHLIPIRNWHSLTEIRKNSVGGCDGLLNNKKSLGHSSIKSWLFGRIFREQNNGYTPRASNTSLKKIGVLASESGGTLTGSGNLQKPDTESIV
jgi:hypothetical protein